MKDDVSQARSVLRQVSNRALKHTRPGRPQRSHLAHAPAIQEKIVRALLTPLVVGDSVHILITLWALGDNRWDLSTWTPLLWTTVLLGLVLFIPRVMWHLGVGRYVDARDGRRNLGERVAILKS